MFIAVFCWPGLVEIIRKPAIEGGGGVAAGGHGVQLPFSSLRK
jgi:hypothetical protein